MTETRLLTQDELVALAIERFGPDPTNWAFVCPSCGDVAVASDFPDGSDSLGQVCVGRHLGALDRDRPETTNRNQRGRGCDWAAGGLFRGPWFVATAEGREIPAFALAEPGAVPTGRQPAPTP